MSTKNPMDSILKKALYFVTLVFVLAACSSDEGPDNTGDDGQETVVSRVGKLPLIEIVTNGATIVNEPKINAGMKVTEGNSINYAGNIGIEFRGSSSQMFPKKGYGIETWDGQNQDVDVSILGFPEEEDWILHGPFSDKSLMRNMLIYDLSRDMGRYASRSKFVELHINDDHQGVYVFMEKLKRDNDRIAIEKLDIDENAGEDLTGGYILKVDKSDNTGYNDQNSFASQIGSAIDPQTSSTIRFLFDYPDPKEITDEQRNYIIGYVNAFESALAGNGFTDPELGYAAFIDVDSFIDFFLLNELSNNVDGYRISTYLNKDKNGKLNMGPIWDFNLGFGNADYCSGGQTNVWAYQFNVRCPGDIWQVPFWWDRLLQDPAFIARLKDRWATLRGNALSNGAIMGKIDGYIDQLDKTGASAANFETWPVLGTYIWPNNFVGQTYSQETNYLKTWLADRLLWMDGAINGL